MRLQISGPSTFLNVSADFDLWYDEQAQELQLRQDGLHVDFRCVRLKSFSPGSISFTALTPPNSGLGQAPAEFTLTFSF